MRIEKVASTGADDAAPYSGTGMAPPFPGEDFLRNAPAGLTFPTDLSGLMAAITIEPDPDDSPGPFLALKPLAATVATAAVDHQTYTLDNHAAEFPTGMATIIMTRGRASGPEGVSWPSRKVPRARCRRNQALQPVFTATVK